MSKSMTKSRETLRLEGNKIHCSPRDQSLSDLLYNKTSGSKWWKTNNHFIEKRKCNSGKHLAGNSELFPV